ncbi:MAG: hypothetical protein U9Q33_05955 [Campylobacterota bacterium]|nr:hypothetical protein [Campylobacterota bacterium]
MLKELGTIALFLGVVLNAYHYFKLHKWSKKDKSFDLILKIVNDLKDIRSKILEAEDQYIKFSQRILQYSYNATCTDEFGNQIPKIEGKPPKNLCYQFMKFEEKTIKVYKDYLFIVKFKKSMQEEKFLDCKITEKFTLEIEKEIRNRLHNLFVSFCFLDETIEIDHNQEFRTMNNYFNCNNLDELFVELE